MNRHLSRLGCLITLFVFAVSQSFAQTYQTYVYEFPQPKNIQAPTNLSNKLDKEIEKVISAGHLAPFRALYGETSVRYYWIRRFETIYALSLAYPYVNESLKPQLLTYLRTELQQYPVWTTSYGNQFLKPSVGTSRNIDLHLSKSQMDSETGGYEYWYAGWPKLFGVYTLWVYANNTGDWQYIDQNWSSIKNFYSSNRGEITQYYQSISGAIGMARLARMKPTPDDSAYQQALTDVSNGLQAGQNFNTFAQTALTTFYDPGAWARSRSYLGFVHQYQTPEIIRFINDTPSLKATILDDSNEFSISQGFSRTPLWYMAQSPHWSGWYGEGWSNNYSIRSWLFPYHRWLLKTPPQTLAQMVDVPDAPIGDNYYLANLVSAIEAHGQTCWVDIRTNQEVSCEQPPVISDPAPSSTPTPAPTACQMTDINQDGIVDLTDYSLLATNFLSTSPSVPRTDINSDGIVDLTDYSLLAIQFLTLCN